MRGHAAGKGSRGSQGWVDLHLYAMATVALFSGLLLWWTNTSWRETLATYPPMLASLRQSRTDIIKGYMTVERHQAGEAFVSLADADAFFEQAFENLDTALTTLQKRREALPESSDDLVSLNKALNDYRRGIAAFRELVRGHLLRTEDNRQRQSVERQAAFAVLEKQVVAIGDAIQHQVMTMARQQDRLNRVLFIVWLSFLGILAVSLSLAGMRRRRAEKALVESEGKYRSLFDQVMDVILLMDEDSGRILDCNQAVTTEWGYDREELLGRNPDMLRLPSPNTGQSEATEVHYADGRRAMLREARLATRFGDVRDVSVKTGFFNLGDRHVRLEIFRDVTERRKDDRALEEREAMLRGLGDNLPDGVIYKIQVLPDGARRFLYVSQGVERLLGLPVARVLENAGTVFAHIAPEDLDVLRQAEARALERLVTVDVQARFFGKDGSLHWGQFRAAPRRVAAGGVIFDGVLVDVTAQKRGEERLRQAMIEAEAASRAKSEFLANISHEVRTPLNGVLGMLQLLELSDLSKEDATHVATALACGRGLVRVLADILDFTLIESGRLVLRQDACDVRTVVDEVLGVFRVESGRKDLDVSADIAPDVPARVTTDTARLRQILFNLVGNAVKFTASGAVRLEVALASRLGDALHLLFTVADTGIGIPEDKLEAIFEPFTQLDGSLTRKYGGTGLGLGIVKRLVGLLQGHITVESEPNLGTRVSFTIRCLTVRELADAGVGRKAAASSAAARVLVVEDEAVNRLATVSMLRKLGFRVDAAEDGDEALDALAGTHYDVVLMDIQMPRVSGDEATRRIRRGERTGIDPRVPIIALTAHAMEGDRERCLACGMDDYLSKPVDMAALGQAVNRAAGKRRMTVD